MAAEGSSSHIESHHRLGVIYKVVILLYILTVVVLSYRVGLTFAAKSAGFVVVGLFLFRVIGKGERIFFPIEYRLLVAWALIGIVSSMISRDPAASVPRIMTMIQVFPIGFVISNLVYWNGDSRFYWLGIVASAVLSGVITLASPMQFTGIDGRLFGTLANANAFAALLAVGVAIALSVIAGTKNIVVRAFCVGLAAFLVYLVARTGSRMGMLATLVGVVVVAVCFQVSRQGKGVTRSAAILVFGLVVVVGSITYLSSSEYGERLAALKTSAIEGDFSASGDTSLSSRARLYKKAFELTLDDPLLGVGLDVFRTAGIEFKTIGNNAHSNYMEILASTGFLGAPIYFAMYLFWWRRLLRSRVALKQERLVFRYSVSVALAAQMLVFDLAWVTYYEKLVWMILAGLIADVHLVSRNVRPERSFNVAWRRTSR